MLYNLLTPLGEDFLFFNLFRYLTFRSGAAVMTALLISFLLGPRIISWLRAKQGEGQRDQGEAERNAVENLRGGDGHEGRGVAARPVPQQQPE